MYLIPLTCVDCESRSLHVIEYRTEKGGLGKAKMSLKRGTTGRMSQPELKKIKKDSSFEQVCHTKPKY